MTMPSDSLRHVMPWAVTFKPIAGTAILNKSEGGRYIWLEPGTYSLVLTTEFDKPTYLSARRNVNMSGAFINLQSGQAAIPGVPRTFAPVTFTVADGETAEVRVFTSPGPEDSDISNYRRAAVQILPLPDRQIF
ncbi:hypothetical protein FQN05_07310 [Corynebacterium aurimucosum]|uniref:Uncharacterized protein n=1 Tax=Corynebacterium aurimucosum TaxID=169292 RepID=A0A558IPE2_9CORY|nr:hypothetical protein [Corynebacterium aurimucosum]TVU83288.1 hypothetical protein FQN05_07310 [Corynebacterium aurimucosum]